MRREREEERGAKQEARQVSSHRREPGRQPKLCSPVPAQQRALWVISGVPFPVASQ